MIIAMLMAEPAACCREDAINTAVPNVDQVETWGTMFISIKGIVLHPRMIYSMFMKTAAGELYKPSSRKMPEWHFWHCRPASSVPALVAEKLAELLAVRQLLEGAGAGGLPAAAPAAPAAPAQVRLALHAACMHACIKLTLAMQLNTPSIAIPKHSWAFF
jgi:hypothetical protein